ncbi:MAG: hypothetical protein KKA84_14215 [Bacteroidetes bacterium]|nr:hypothetical protein [Bacteroidota bacterium]
MRQTTHQDILNALLKSWSVKSSSLYTPENPAKGQCGVTALVANDLLGGDILKTRIGNQWHFYNIINGERIDFTASQFQTAINYDDLPSTREEAFDDTDELQLVYLSTRVIEFLFDSEQ